MKRCTKCERLLPLDAFMRYGRRWTERGYRRPDCRECVATYRRQHYAANRAAIRAAQATYFKQNREAFRARRDRYMAEHPVANALYLNRRRALKRGTVIGRLTPREWEAELVLFAGRCGYCNRPAALTQDHVYPIARGGAHALGNVIPACRSCNSRKGGRTLLEFIPHMEVVAA